MTRLNSKLKTDLATKRDIVFFIRTKSKDKLLEILRIENEEKNRWLEKVIESYVPNPPKKMDGKFIPLYWGSLRKLLKKDPHIYMVGLYQNKTIGAYEDAIEDYNKDKITWEQFKDGYLYRLQQDDAQEKIKELKMLSENRDIYILSIEKDEEKSLRKIFCDYINDVKQ